MKPRQASLLVQALLFVNSVLLTLGLTRILLFTNGLDESVFKSLGPALLALGVLNLLFTPPRRGLVTLFSLMLGGMLLLLLAPDLVMPVRDWLMDFGIQLTSAFMYFTSQGGMTESLLAFTIPTVTVLVALLVHMTAVWIYAPLLPATGLLTLMAVDAYLGLRQDVIGIALAGAAILVLLVRRLPVQHQPQIVRDADRYQVDRQAVPGRSRVRAPRRHSLAALLAAIPIIAVAMALSLALSPIYPTRIGRQQQLIEGLVDDFTQMLGIPPVQELQPDFSISAAGYYPVETQLGGPVTLVSAPAMDVAGHNRTMLLRGAIYERYDGYSWHRDPRGETFRFDNPFEKDLRARVFDLDQPNPDVVSGGVVTNLIEENRLSITPLSRSTGMIFTPGRPVTITPKTAERFQVHYDDYGMLYSKYPLTVDNPYEVVSRVPITGGQYFQNSILLAQEVGNSRQEPRENLYPPNYLNVPTLGPYATNGSLRRLVRDITTGVDNPYDKVLAIRNYLMANATYRLDVPVPPEGREFVSWFLASKEGYCVYFATAQTVLSRLAGVPARYVEGFILDAPTQAGGTTTVMTDRAHAWTEVYLPYVGWVQVDATPGGSQPGQVDPNDPAIADLTPGAELTPEETEPEPTEEPIDPAETPEEVQARERRYMLFLVLPILLVLLALGLEAQRRDQLLRHPLRLRADYPDPRQRAEIYWQEIQLLLAEDRLRMANGETPISFLRRASRRHPGSEPRFAEASRLISRIRYSRYLPKETDLAFLAGLIAKLDENGRELRRLRHVFGYTLLPRMHSVDGQPRLIRGHFLKPLTRLLRRQGEE